MKIVITGGSGFIGTNLIEYYIGKKYQVLNIDIQPPRNNNHYQFWKKTDIKNYNELYKILFDFNPEYILHMAADTGLKGSSLTDYSTNIEGVKNLILVSNKIISIRKIIFASTMLVCKAGYIPKTETDYCPTTLYGISKVKGEEMVRESNTKFSWTIIRPTSIWGPWFGRTYREFFEMIMAGKYYNFSGKMCTKTYGYIGNVVYQINEILLNETTDKKTLYVGDYYPTAINQWAIEIAKEVGVNVYTIPRFLIIVSAWLGDLFNYFGLRFPMNSFRFSNMTTDNILDLSETKKIAPKSKFLRDEGNRLTIKWIKDNLKG